MWRSEVGISVFPLLFPIQKSTREGDRLEDKEGTLFGKQDWVKTEIQIEALTLIQNITENRIKHARGPVQTSVP